MDNLELKPAELIIRESEAGAMCAKLAQSDQVAVDTEFEQPLRLPGTGVLDPVFNTG